MFTRQQDAAIIHYREERGFTFPSIAGELDCGTTERKVRDRYYVLTGRQAARLKEYGGRIRSMTPLWVEEERPDDDTYVQIVKALGGFTRENFWGLAPSPN